MGKIKLPNGIIELEDLLKIDHSMSMPKQKRQRTSKYGSALPSQILEKMLQDLESSMSSLSSTKNNMTEHNQQEEWNLVDEVSSEFFELIPKDFNYKNRDRKTLYNWLKTRLESTLQDQRHSIISTLKSEVEGMKKEGSLTCRACGTGLLGPAYGMGKVSFELQCKVCGNYQEENEDVKEYNSALQQVINIIEKYQK